LTVTVSEPFVLLLAIAVGVLACARVVRLLIDDDFPPVLKVRVWYLNRTADSNWQGLFECPWCMAPYITLPNILFAWASGLAWYWWLPNAWAAASWAVSYVSLRDIPPESRE